MSKCIMLKRIFKLVIIFSTFQYIRLSPCSDLEVVWNLMTQQWKLPIPKLLISVTGGAQRFELSPKLKSVFKKGLINAATSTGKCSQSFKPFTTIDKSSADNFENIQSQIWTISINESVIFD